MAKQIVRSIRKGSNQWNEDDRLALANLLVKAGYCVKLGRQITPGKENSSKPTYENTVEYWEEQA